MTPSFIRGVLACAQMLPATVIVPMIRPWLTARFGDGAIHPFLAVNMLAAALAAPVIVAGMRRWPRRTVLRCAAATDALLLASFALPLPLGVLLALRAAEGVAHVTALIALLAEAGDARSRGQPRAVAAAGTGLVCAIAFGTLVGTALAAAHLLAPLLAGAGLAALVAIAGPRMIADGIAARRVHARGTARRLAASIAAAFVARFAVGALVATFALFAHRVHGLSDREIGLLYTSLTVPFALSAFPLALLCRIVPARSVTAAGVAGYAIVLAVLGWVPPPALPFVMFAGGVTSSAVFGAVLVEAAALPTSDERAHGMALINGAGCLGMVLGPTVGGIVLAALGSNLDGYRTVFCAAAAVAAVWCIGAAVTPLTRAARGTHGTRAVRSAGRGAT